MSGESDIPRWARELEERQWVLANEMIDAGHKTSDIVRELAIPDSKVRSLQEYVRKCGPKRRLVQFARFKDALLTQIDKFGKDMVTALQVTAALAVSNETPPAAQVRAIEAMNNFVKTLSQMMAVDRQVEKERKRSEEGQSQAIDPAEAVRRVLDKYDVPMGGGA